MEEPVSTTSLPLKHHVRVYSVLIGVQTVLGIKALHLQATENSGVSIKAFTCVAHVF